MRDFLLEQIVLSQISSFTFSDLESTRMSHVKPAGLQVRHAQSVTYSKQTAALFPPIVVEFSLAGRGILIF